MPLLLVDRPLRPPEGPLRPLGPWAAADRSALEPGPYADPADVGSAAAASLLRADRLLETLLEVLPPLSGGNPPPRRFWEVYLRMPATFIAGQLVDLELRAALLGAESFVLGAPDAPPETPPDDFPGLARALLGSSGIRQHLAAAVVRAARPDVEETRVGYRRDALSPAGTPSGTWRPAAARAWTSAETALVRAGSSRKVPAGYLWDHYRLRFQTRRALSAAGLPPGPTGPAPAPAVADPTRRREAFARLPEPDRTALTLALPTTCLEGLEANLRAARRLNEALPLPPKTLVTFGQLWSAPAHRRAAAGLLAAAGTKLISVQHGNGYGGAYASSLNASVEYRLSDLFVTWGWTQDDEPLALGARAQPLPSVMMSALAHRPPPRRRRWKVLFLLHTEPPFVRWHYPSPYPDRASDYLKREAALLKGLGDAAPAAAKLSSADEGWGQEALIRSGHPRLELIRTGSFPDLMRRAELCVTDYNSTGFLEMLAAGTPFMATWDRAWVRGSAAFESALETLKAAGVFHDDPESLVAEYRAAAGDILGWWGEERRQSAVRAFARRYAATATDAEGLLARLAYSAGAPPVS